MEKLERTKNAKRNIGYGLINKVLTLLLPFFLKTIIIKKLGAEFLGLNSLFTSILGVLNLTELGFGSAVVFSMYKPIAERDNNKLCSLLNLYKKVYRIVGVFIFIVGLVILPFLPMFIHGDVPEGIDVYFAFLIFLANTCLSYVLFAYKKSLLNAHQRNDIISNIGSFVIGSLNLIQICLLIKFSSYYAFIVVMPLFTILENLVTNFVVNRLYPNIICQGMPSKDEIKDIKKKVAGLLINKLCQMSRNSFDCIFLSTFLGLSVTAIYSNYYYIMSAIVGIMAVFATSLIAGIGNSTVTDTREKNYLDLKRINFLYMWISGWFTCCLLCLYQPFMSLWVGESLMLPFSMVILFCMYFYVLKMGDVRAIYLEAVGLWWENRYRMIFESLANIILDYILIIKMGVHGVIAATLITLLIINFGMGSHIVFKFYFKNGKLQEYFKYHLLYFTVTCLSTGFTFVLCQSVPTNGYIGFIIKASLCLIIPNLIYLAIYKKSSIYKTSLTWVFERRIIPQTFKRILL